jgi:hypothetical protein
MTDEESPTESQPTESQPTESQPTEAQPTEAQPTEAQTEVMTPNKPWWRRPGVLGLIAGGVALLTAIALVVVLVVLPDKSNQADQQEVFLEPTASPGQDSFTEASYATPPQPPVTNPGPDPAGPPPAQANQVRTVYGDTDGLFGGTQNETTCDAEGLITYLQQRPDKAAAWASVPKITVEQIPGYIRQLTPVLLRNDTRVIDHGYVNGQAYSRQAVLQALTAVLVDKYGIPRVRCVSGSPLLEIPVPQAQPAPQPGPQVQPAPRPPSARPPVFIGQQWRGFNPRVVVVILRPLRNRIIDFIILLDLRNVRLAILFARRIGIILADLALDLVRPPRPIVAGPPAPLPLQPPLPPRQDLAPVQAAPEPVPAAPPPPPPLVAPPPVPVPAPPLQDPGPYVITDPGYPPDTGPLYPPLYPPVYNPPVYDPPMPPHQQPGLVPPQQIPQQDPGVTQAPPSTQTCYGPGSVNCH